MPYRSYAEFARTKGAKDKGKRKSRAGMIAGGVAGAGALGAGIRYGGAALNYRKAQKNFDAKTVLRGGAKGQWDRDMAGISNSKAGQYVRGKADAVAKSKFGQGVASKYAGLKDALTKERGTNKYIGKTLGGRIARGGGLLAAAGGTAAVLSYLKNRKKNKK
jgi:hypothetical protein